MSDKLLDVNDLADAFGVSKRTAEMMARNGQLPIPMRAGRKRLWHLPHVIEHMQKRAEAGGGISQILTKKKPRSTGWIAGQ